MADPKRRNISQRSEMIYDTHHFGLLLDTREIFVAPDGSDDDKAINETTANTFIRNLRILNIISHEPILIHMITNGGDWNYGMAMYDAIKTSPSDVVVLSYAHARSMSSIIPQAATWRVIMPSADYLIHFGDFAINTKYTSAIAEADWAKHSTNIMLDVYAERAQHGQFFKREGMDFKRTKEWIETQMKLRQEFYMTPREAVDKGFMDAVLGDDEFETIEALRNIE